MTKAADTIRSQIQVVDKMFERCSCCYSLFKNDQALEIPRYCSGRHIHICSDCVSAIAEFKPKADDTFEVWP